MEAQSINRKALLVIMVTTCLNIVGYGLIIPVAPFLIAQYVSNPNDLGFTVGLLTTTYAVFQFIAAPGLGAISDRVGRRPILLICLLGSAVGFLLLGIGGALWVLFLGRIIDGLTGANSSVILAYVADLTPADERSKYFGWIGALEGLGLVLGPTIGGLLAKFGIQAPFYAAAGIAFISFIVGLLFVPESLAKSQRAQTVSIVRLNPFSTLWDVLKLPQLRWLLIAIFFFTLPLYALQSNLGLYAKDSLGWNADSIGALFTLFGIASIIVQAVILQLLLKKLSGIQLTISGLIIAVLAFLLIASVSVVGSQMLLYGGILLMALGDGFASPNLSALLSQGADAASQGKVQGGSKSLQYFAGVISPVLVGFLYDRLGHSSPYLIGAGMFALTIGALLIALPMLRRSAPLASD